MTAKLHASVVLTRTANALADVLPNHAPVTLGALLQRAHTTAPRWADDLTAWPTADFLRLVCADEQLHREFLAALTPTQPAAHPMDAERDLRVCIKRAGGSIQRAMTVLDNDLVEAHEIPETIVILRELQEAIDTALTDLQARAVQLASGK